jgi:hypothetical protein
VIVYAILRFFYLPHVEKELHLYFERQFEIAVRQQDVAILSISQAFTPILDLQNSVNA